MQWGGIGRSNNDAIGMNPTGTIASNVPQGDMQSIFDSISGIYDFSNSIFPWHDETISENTGREICFEVENYGHKNLKFSFKNSRRLDSCQLDKHQTEKST